VAGQRRLLTLTSEKQIGQPDKIARGAFKRAGIWREGMACHAFRGGGLSKLHDDVARAGDPYPLRVAMTAADHANITQTESYLDKSMDRKHLAELCARMYGEGEQQPAREAEPVIAEPESTGTVVSLADWRKRATG
jgi:hypothetical protein